MKPIAFHVPGKLVLSGEWSILQPGNACITLPTRGINIRIEPAAITTISSPTYGLLNQSIAALKQNPETTLLHTTIAAGLAAVAAHGKQQINFHLSLENDPRTYIQANSQLHKLGIGSSACVAVGTIKAITMLHGILLDTTELFKLAAKAHYAAQQKLGSCFDIAAAAAGQSIVFQSFNTSKAIDHDDWGLLTIKPIAIPQEWIFAIGFSGTSAGTTTLIKIFNDAWEKNPLEILPILTCINVITLALEKAITNNDLKVGMALINENRQLLRELSGICNKQLETPPLTTMIDLANAQGAAAKFSGAGGGDCVIALCPDEPTKHRVYSDWKAAGFGAVNNLLMV